MKYLLLCCFEEKRWDALPQSRRDGIMSQYGELIDGLKTSGHHVTTAKLQPTAAATTVRSRNDKPLISDGPFAETKEQLGGYHVLECKDLDEAIAIAKRIPTLPYGGTVEVRPIEETR